MTSRLYSDEELDAFRSIRKRVTNAGARWIEKPGHRQRTYQVTGDEDIRFAVYQRQSMRDERNFSCGIVYLPSGSARLTLARYNGPSHIHGDIAYEPHIHRATASAIAAGKRPESRAEATDRYVTLDGAFGCLIDDYKLTGITRPKSDEPRLWI